MRKLNQTGSLLAPFIVVLVLFLGAAGFAVWAFGSRQDYKNNSDQKGAAAVKVAIVAEDIKKDADFADALKIPVKSFSGPQTYGSLKFDFPKSWNEYIPTPDDSKVVNNYYNPDYIPDINAATSQYALRVQISNTPYATLLKGFESSVQSGSVVVTTFRAPKVDSVSGSMVTGIIHDTTPGILVYLPIRDKTIILWTEGSNYRDDFLKTVLPSVTFSP